VTYRDLCALVHLCPSDLYPSEDSDLLARWVLAHHRVVEAAWKLWGTVLPVNFNTLLSGEHPERAMENVKDWLAADYSRLRAKLEALERKAEWGVQLWGDAKLIGQQVAEATPELQRLREELRSKPAGLAYMYRQKLELEVKRASEAKTVEEVKNLYERLSSLVDRIHVEKTRREEGGRRVLLDLSCLAPMQQSWTLPEELNRLPLAPGFSLRFTGPLPPYSFC